jgi:hypothetical protein
MEPPACFTLTGYGTASISAQVRIPITKITNQCSAPDFSTTRNSYSTIGGWNNEAGALELQWIDEVDL